MKICPTCGKPAKRQRWPFGSPVPVQPKDGSCSYDIRIERGAGTVTSFICHAKTEEN